MSASARFTMTPSTRAEPAYSANPAALVSEPCENSSGTRPSPLAAKIFNASTSETGSATRAAVRTARVSLGTTSQPVPLMTITPAAVAASSAASECRTAPSSAVVSR
jgi:hypothetical protein